MSRFSIILPVRNGGEYVKECVQSILAQTFTDFNFQILDNSSTDGTVAWIQSLNDSRITIFPSEKSLTIEENWSRILNIPKNEFITLIGHDDILEPHYLETMQRLIEKHPDASLYQSHFRYIDSVGKRIRLCKPMDEVQNSSEFLGFFLSSMIDVMGSGFMMRSRDYENLGGIPPSYPSLLFADFELLIGLTSINYKATAVEECFAFRLHQSTTTTSPDITFHKAYGHFIDYLVKLKNRDDAMKLAISRYALDFIKYYTKGLSHRLLRTDQNKRQGLTMKKFLENCKLYADKLVENNDFNPSQPFSVKLARQIDTNILFRKMFHVVRKMYAKPFYT